MSNYTRLLGSNGSFDQMIRRFGVVTVMNARFYEGVDYTQPRHIEELKHLFFGVLNSAEKPAAIYIGKADTLKISNISQEGPTKTITGGQYANPLIKFGKTARLEMQNALGNIQLVDALNGGVAEWKSSTTSMQLPAASSANLLTPTNAYDSEVISVDQVNKLIELCDNQGGTLKVNLQVSPQSPTPLKLTRMSLKYFDAFTHNADHHFPCLVFWPEGSGSVGMILYQYNQQVYAACQSVGDERPMALYAEGTDPTIAKILLDSEGYVGVHFGSDFNSPKTIVGDTFFLDDKGNEIPVKIIIYQFLPDSLFNLTQDAEGDATVFDMNGDLLTTNINIPTKSGTYTTHGLFYSIVAPSATL